jgi:hypothetical protein
VQTIHQKLVDRVDDVRQGRTWRAIGREIGINPSRFSQIRWQPSATFGPEAFRKIEEWVDQEEEIQRQRAMFRMEEYIRHGGYHPLHNP